MSLIIRKPKILFALYCIFSILLLSASVIRLSALSTTKNWITTSASSERQDVALATFRQEFHTEKDFNQITVAHEIDNPAGADIYANEQQIPIYLARVYNNQRELLGETINTVDLTFDFAEVFTGGDTYILELTPATQNAAGDLIPIVISNNYYVDVIQGDLEIDGTKLKEGSDLYLTVSLKDAKRYSIPDLVFLAIIYIPFSILATIGLKTFLNKQDIPED